MFCGECGTKNKKDDLFCANCGTKLEQEENEKKPTKNMKEKKIDNKESKIERVQNLSNKNNSRIIIVIVLAIALGIGYKCVSSLTSPEKVAEEFINAEINNDSNKLYNYLNIEGDKTFVSKKIFKKIVKEDDSTSEINNYKVTGVSYGKGKLTATVKFSYTTKKSSTEKTGSVNLTKQKNKKYVIFDDWRISDSLTDALVIKDFSIQVPKKTKLVYEGIEVKDKYLSKKESTSSKDVYVLPQVFLFETDVKATLENDIVIKKKITPSSYSKIYKLDYDKNSITNKEKKEVTNESKKIIDDLYNKAILGKKYEDIKEDYSNVSDKFEEKYNKFVSDLVNSSNKLKQFSVKSSDIYDLSLNDDGNLKVKLKVNYNYKIEYSSFDGEVKTSENSNYSYMTLIIAKDKKKYFLVDIDYLKTYFYR